MGGNLKREYQVMKALETHPNFIQAYDYTERIADDQVCIEIENQMLDKE